MIDKARKCKALILDLRGSRLGDEATLLRIVGHLFDHDVKVADLISRKGTRTLLAKTHRDRVFKGQLVMLVDSRTSSNAEVLARVVQLEKRGITIGDRTTGAVRTNKLYEHHDGPGTSLPYFVSVTDAEILMSDGKSLEHSGVRPAELLLSNAADIAGRRDPVMTRAASILGVRIDPQEAGKLFPNQWQK
jgi:C-terminal processing protease CtpA/Prc